MKNGNFRRIKGKPLQAEVPIGTKAYRLEEQLHLDSHLGKMDTGQKYKGEEKKKKGKGAQL